MVLEILRTILHTPVAARASAHEYLVDAMHAEPEEVGEQAELFAPFAWSIRQLLAEPE